MRTSLFKPQSSPSVLPYGIALFSVLTAALILFSVGQSLHPILFPLFFASVIISAWYGGFGPGAMATALSAVAIFILSLSQSVATSPASIALIAVFILVSLLISWLSGALDRRLARSREREEWFKEILKDRRTPSF